MDLFHHKPIVKGQYAWIGGVGFEDLDSVVLLLRKQILREYDFDAGEKGIFDALKARCLDNAFDPLLDYLDGLVWDRKPRLDTWLIDLCGAEDTKLNRAIGRKVLIGAVRRARQPGCKFDYIMVLEGEQGIGKLGLLRILAGDEFFCDKAIIGCDSREQQESVQGVWICEIAELHGISNADTTWIKALHRGKRTKPVPPLVELL